MYAIAETEEKKPVKAGSMDFLEDIRVKEYNTIMLDCLKNRGRMSLGPLDEVQKLIDEYFELCLKESQIPSIKALALYIGVTLKTLEKYMNDVSSPYYNMLQMAKDMCHVVLENLALNNKVNPATYMFTSANYYGMKNTQSVEINKNNMASSSELEKASDVINALKSIVSDPVVKKVVDMPVEEVEVVEKK